jgi:predicted O-methyltransferase YrrM
VPEQFEKDQTIGTPQNKRRMFSNNSMNLARRILDQHGCDEVELVQGDIIRISDKALAPNYSSVLLDMDLSEPTYQALRRFWRHLASGGVIYVDDCPPEGDWKARVGYRRFCSEMGLPERYHFGLGIVEKPGYLDVPRLTI